MPSSVCCARRISRRSSRGRGPRSSCSVPTRRSACARRSSSSVTPSRRGNASCSPSTSGVLQWFCTRTTPRHNRRESVFHRHSPLAVLRILMQPDRGARCIHPGIFLRPGRKDDPVVTDTTLPTDAVGDRAALSRLRLPELQALAAARGISGVSQMRKGALVDTLSDLPAADGVTEQGEPAAEQPAAEQPAPEQPAEAQPAAEQPAEGQPAAEDGAAETTVEQPAETAA